MKVTSITDDFVSEFAPRILLPKARIRSCVSRLIVEMFERTGESSKAGVMLTSPVRSAGVSFICSSIAAELALQGMKVLLMDARALVAVRSKPSKIVISHCRRIGSLQLWVLGAQEVAGHEDGSDEKASSISSLLQDLEQEFPYLLIDAPALSAGREAQLLATSVYGTILVARRGYTGVVELGRTQRELSAFGGRVLGSVFNAH